MKTEKAFYTVEQYTGYQYEPVPDGDFDTEAEAIACMIALMRVCNFDDMRVMCSDGQASAFSSDYRVTDPTVLLTDGTVGTLRADSIDYQDPDFFIGERVTVHLHDENGNAVEVVGVLEEVLKCGA